MKNNGHVRKKIVDYNPNLGWQPKYDLQARILAVESFQKCQNHSKLVFSWYFLLCVQFFFFTALMSNLYSIWQKNDIWLEMCTLHHPIGV